MKLQWTLKLMKGKLLKLFTLYAILIFLNLQRHFKSKFSKIAWIWTTIVKESEKYKNEIKKFISVFKNCKI